MSVPTPILQYNLSDATMKGLLPAGYTPLAYIESTTSGQYIDTGFKYLSGDITVDCEYTVPSNDSSTIFGSSNDNTKWLCLIHKSGSNSLHYCGTISAGWANSELSGNKRKITYSISGTTCTLNDGKLSVSSSCGTIPAQTYSYTLWCHHYSNTFTQYAQNAKIYYFRLIYRGNLTLDYRPARRDSDGVIGMYDLVSRTFKTNAGSGTFIAGPELAVGKGGGKSLPEEYLLVEYLYNEDKTSWINFNRTLKSNTIMKVNMQVVSYLTGAVYQQIMGYATNTSWNPYSLGIYNNVFTLYSGTVDSTALPTSNFRQVVWTNSVETIETSGSTLGLFHMAGSPGDYANAGIKVQCCQILEGSSIIIKAFPCYRKSDMKPGMYDVVNGVFYTNAGSGEFILGPTVTNYYSCEPNGSGKAALNPYDTTIYTESDGSRWMRIFHHNNPANSRFASSANLSNLVYESADKWACINLINKDLGNWELMLKLKDTSSSSEVKYRWIQYYNPFTANWSLVLPGNVLNVSGYSGTQGGMWAMNSSDTYFVIANTSSSNWFGAIGGKSVYQGGIPGYPNTTCTTGYMDLYVRIDNNASFEPIGLYNNVSCAYDSRFNYVSSFSGSSWIDIGTILNGRSVKNTTTALWVNTDTQSGAILLAGSLHGSSQRYYIGRYNGLYDFGLGGTGWVGGISGASATVGSWAFLVLTIDSSGIPRFYYNGTLVATREAVNYNFSGNFLIGCANANESYFQGKIYNFMFFNTALTAAQIKELYGG